MKTVFLSRLFNPHVGGVENHVYNLSLELIKKGFKVRVITEQYDKNLKLAESIDGIEITRIPYSSLQSKRALWAFMDTQKKVFRKAGIIHVHDVFWWYLPLRLLQVNNNVFTTFHGYEPGGYPPVRNKIHRKIVEILSSKTICIGDFMRKWYWANPDLLLYGASRLKKTKKVNKNSAVFLGRLESDTGIFEYLKALAIMGNKLSLDIYGNGPERREVESYIKKNRLKASLHDWTNNPKKAIVNARYVFSSQYLTILEAMQSKKLVMSIFGDDMKMDYLFSHPMANNMLIAKNGADLADKIGSITESYENELTKRAYEWAKDQTWKDLTSKYISLWGL